MNDEHGPQDDFDDWTPELAARLARNLEVAVAAQRRRAMVRRAKWALGAVVVAAGVAEVTMVVLRGAAPHAAQAEEATSLAPVRRRARAAGRGRPLLPRAPEGTSGP